jgi:nucleotide-binding universal stress UspA family protein
VSRIKIVLVPLDFSEYSSAALGLAIELAQTFEARVHLLHAYELPVGVTAAYGVAIPQAVWDGVREAATKRLQTALQGVEAAGVQGETHLVPSTPVEAITETARTLPADLIVMGTRGLTGLKHVLLGSVAERTLRLAPCPVLTVKARADEAD